MLTISRNPVHAADDKLIFYDLLCGAPHHITAFAKSSDNRSWLGVLSAMGKRHEKDNWIKQRVAPSSTSLPYMARTNLLTSGERRFYHQGLRPAIGDRYLISFKVRLADVITVENWESKYGRKIAQKHLDFVLATPKSTRTVAAVELNDATHDSSDRQRRDDFLSQALHSAGIPLITFPVYQKYDAEKIRRRILAAIATARRRNYSTDFSASALCGVETSDRKA